MSGALPGTIHRHRVLGMSPRQGLRKRVLKLRHADDMNVIVHQAIAQNPGAVMGGVPGQKTQIETSVCSRIKYGLAIVSPLCDVVGNAGNHYARATGHTAKVPGPMQSSQELNRSEEHTSELQ